MKAVVATVVVHIVEAAVVVTVAEAVAEDVKVEEAVVTVAEAAAEDVKEAVVVAVVSVTFLENAVKNVAATLILEAAEVVKAEAEKDAEETNPQLLNL